MKNSDAYIIPGVKSIDEIIADTFGVTVEQMKAKSRKQPGKDARFFAMWWRLTRTEETQSAVGIRYGGRDHATALHARNKVNDWLGNDKKFRKKAEQAIEVLDKIKIN